MLKRKFEYTRINIGSYSVNHSGSWQHQLLKHCVNV